MLPIAERLCDQCAVTSSSTPNRLWLLAAGALLLVVVLAIGRCVQRGLTAGIDASILIAMRDGPVGFWRFWTVVGDSGGRVGVTLVVAGALILARHRRDALLLLGTVFGGMALNSGLKLAFSRVRPGLLPHLDKVDTFSFPSGHAANSMILALALALLAPVRWRLAAVGVAVAVAVLIGLSRLSLAVHWPSDVVAGWIEGIGWVLLVRGLATRRAARHG